MITGDFVVIIAGKNCDIVFESPDPLNNNIDQHWIQVEVKIRQLHKTESLKRRGQLWQDDFVLHDLHIQKVPLADLVETSKLERMPDECIHRDNSLKHEEALALMDFSRPKASLLADSPLKNLPAHALSQFPIIGMTRSF